MPTHQTTPTFKQHVQSAPINLTLDAKGALGLMRKPSSVVKAVYHEHIHNFGEPAESIRYEDPPNKDTVSYPAFIDVMVWPPEQDLNITTYATIGMSDKEMSEPNSRAELHFGIEGCLDKETSAKITIFLANLSLYPFMNKTFFDWWHVIPNVGEIPHFNNMHSVLLYPAFLEDGWETICTNQGHVKILNVVPITTNELAIYKASGIDSLINYFVRNEINFFVPR